MNYNHCKCTTLFVYILIDFQIIKNSKTEYFFILHRKNLVAGNSVAHLYLFLIWHNPRQMKTEKNIDEMTREDIANTIETTNVQERQYRQLGDPRKVSSFAEHPKSPMFYDLIAVEPHGI